MSYNFNALNKTNGVEPAELNTEDFEYTHIREYAGEVLPVLGFFFTNGDHGRQVVLITTNCFVNMPKRSVEEFEKIAKDPDAVAAILAGELVLTDIVPNVKTKSGNETVIYKFANASDVTKKKGKGK